MYFDHAPKHMIRLSVVYQQDLKIPIRLWKSLVGDTPNTYIYIFFFLYCMYMLYIYIYIYTYCHGAHSREEQGHADED